MARSLVNVKVDTADKELTQLLRLAEVFDSGEIVNEIDSGLATIRKLIRERARREPDGVRYPIKWAPSRHAADAEKAPNTQFGYYSRQKAAFYRTRGFGAGIPTRRDHSLAKAWDVRTRRRRYDAVLELTNDSPEFPFVEGEWQQEFHDLTGWDTEDTIIADVQAIADLELPKLIDRVIASYVGD